MVCKACRLYPQKQRPPWRNGRRTRLKIVSPQGRAGSSPAGGTIFTKGIALKDEPPVDQTFGAIRTTKKLFVLQMALLFGFVFELIAMTAPGTLRVFEAVLVITALTSPLTWRLYRKCRAYGVAHYALFQPTTSRLKRAAAIPPKALFTLVFFLLPASIILPLNRMWDNADATIQQVEITDKRYSTSTDNKGHTTDRYRVKYLAPVKSIIPFGPENYTQTMRVEYPEYRFLTPHASTIELEIHPGFLGLPWVRRTSKRLSTGALPNAALTAAACRYTAHYNQDTEILAMEPTGYNREYWPNGKIKSEEPLVYGKPHGMAHYTFDNGKKYADIPWKNGKKHGVFTLLRADGSREMRLSYRNGTLYGVSEWYNEAGNLRQRALYMGDDSEAQDAAVCDHYK